MRKMIVAALAAMVMVTGLSADEKIEGAFGYKLGEVFDTSKAEHSYGNCYTVYPDKTLKYFNNYTVCVTPTTRRIESVIGFGTTGKHLTLQECNKDLRVVSLILEKKYGSFTSDTSSFFAYEKRIKQSGMKRIELKCDGVINIDFKIDYSDFDMYRLSTEESLVIENARLERESKTVDTSSL